MNEEPLISIVVPIYKVQKYLRKCVDSLCHQTYKNLQVILIDDGSPDQCGLICDELAKTDSRITVIHQKNSGLSTARNCGVQHAKGEYILFVDSDDFIHKDMIYILYTNMIAFKADVSMCHHVRASDICLEDEEVFERTIDNDITVYNGKQMCERFFGESYLDVVVVWNKLFKRDVFNKFRFPPNSTCEDEAIILQILYESNTIVESKGKLYAYMSRGDNITTIMSKSEFAPEGKVDIVYNNFQYMFQHGEVEIAKKLFFRFMSFTIRRLSYLCNYENDKYRYRHEMNKYKEYYITAKKLIKLPLLFKLYYKLFFLFDIVVIRLRGLYKACKKKFRVSHK